MTIEELKAKKAEMDAEFKKHGEKAVKAAFREFFESNPTIKAVAWDQYAPHFNDGEPCVFHVRDFYGTTEELDSPEDIDRAYSLGDEGGGGLSYKSPEYEALSLFQDRVVDDDLFEAVFGDSSTVVVTPDAITVNECYHD